MKNTKPCLLVTIFFCMGQGLSHYSTAAVDTILNLLKTHHKIEIKRRWLFQCLRDLEDDGLIRRSQRYRNDNSGLIHQIPSMLSLPLRGIVWLRKMGVSGALKIYKAMVKFKQTGDKRFPNRKEFDDDNWKPETAEDRKALEGLLEGLTNPIGQN